MVPRLPQSEAPAASNGLGKPIRGLGGAAAQIYVVWGFVARAPREIEKGVLSENTPKDVSKPPLKRPAAIKIPMPKRRAAVPKARWVVVPKELLAQAMKDAEEAMQAGEEAMAAAEKAMAASCHPPLRKPRPPAK
jgi:hypothetical protein